MILTCNSCEKKFVVPDNAIGASGRLVQCSSCGNKWKQFPVKETIKTEKKVEKKLVTKKPEKLTKKVKTKKIRKRKGPDLYSPEYLARKHGIKLNEIPKIKEKPINKKSSIGFGFYNYLILVSVFLITFLKLLHFFQDKIMIFIPGSSIYLNYLFETIRNIKEILLNFVLY